MLNTSYTTYMKESIKHLVKPSPKGAKTCKNDNIDYQKAFANRMQEELTKVRKAITEEFVEIMKKELIGRTILMRNEKGHVKILKVSDVVIDKMNGVFYPLIKQDDKITCWYMYDAGADRSKITFIDTFLKFFEEHYLDEYIGFQGRSIKSGFEGKFTRHIVRIGIQRSLRDSILVEDDTGARYQLAYESDIKVYDEKLKDLDPYGEEDWEK